MRLKSASLILEKEKALPFLCSEMTNIRYLSGFEGSYGYILFKEDDIYFITDSRYEEYASALFAGQAKVLRQKDSFFNVLSGILNNEDSLFVEDQSMTVSTYESLKNQISCPLMHVGDIIERMRMIKDENEIELIGNAVDITDKCASFIYETAHCSMTEWELSVEIENFYRRNGCRKSAFDSIVASGNGSSMPHYIPSMSRKLEQSAPLLVDMGALKDGYNSDLTRTFFMEKVPDKISEIYDIVLEAQMTAINSVRAGKTTGEIDSAAREYISKKGYGDYFGHSLGHGVGMQIHELPSVKKGGSTVLEPGMVITIEPGIYFPGEGGVRIEDVVVVRENNCEILTGYTKNKMIIKG